MQKGFVHWKNSQNTKPTTIFLVIDRSTKVPHFISVKTTHCACDIAHIFIIEVVRLHHVLKVIVSY